MAVRNAPVLREKIAVLLAKDAIEPIPPAEKRQGFYSPYFIVPKKVAGLRPILDLRVLNRALHKLPFKMRTRRRIIKCIQSQDWFAAIDLKDEGLLSRCLETLAWIRAQGSHQALPRSGGEPASTALGGGRSSLSIAVSRKSIAHIRELHPERQKL